MLRLKPLALSRETGGAARPVVSLGAHPQARSTEEEAGELARRRPSTGPRPPSSTRVNWPCPRDPLNWPCRHADPTPSSVTPRTTGRRLSRAPPGPSRDGSPLAPPRPANAPSRSTGYARRDQLAPRSTARTRSASLSVTLSTAIQRRSRRPPRPPASPPRPWRQVRDQANWLSSPRRQRTRLERPLLLSPHTLLSRLSRLSRLPSQVPGGRGRQTSTPPNPGGKNGKIGPRRAYTQ